MLLRRCFLIRIIWLILTPSSTQSPRPLFHRHRSYLLQVKIHHMTIAFLLWINNNSHSSKASRLGTKWPLVRINLIWHPIFKLCRRKLISIIVSSNSSKLQLINSNSHSSRNSNNRLRASKTLPSRLAVIIVPQKLLLTIIQVCLMPSPSKAEGRDLRTCPSHRPLKIYKCASNSLTWPQRRKRIWKRS